MTIDQKKLHRPYEKLEKLGTGAYGAVYKIREKESGSIYALKKTRIYDGEESLSVHVIREYSILQSLNHPNIIKVIKIEIDKEKNKAHIYFELMEETLKSMIEFTQLTYGHLKSLTRQLLEGLHYLHHHLIIHRDIKPMNILVRKSDGSLKIADFGLAKAVSLPFPPLSLEIQTLWYKAPELLLGDENYNMSIDCWAAGCVIAEMVLGKSLFGESSEIGQLFKIFEMIGSPSESHYLTSLPFYKRTFPKFKPGKLRGILGSVEPCLVDLIEGLLMLDPKLRFSAEEALKTLFLI